MLDERGCYSPAFRGGEATSTVYYLHPFPPGLVLYSVRDVP
jgi:hypothetical protein